MRAPLWAAIILAGLALSAAAPAQPVASDIAPGGRLLVALLVTNPVLAIKKPDGTLVGMAPDLGRFIADKLGARFEPVSYQDPQSLTASYGKNEWDILIGPRTEAATARADFSPDVMLVDNLYLAAPGRDFAGADQVDRPGTKIAVARDGAPDQFLSRTLRHAALVRITGDIAETAEALRTGQADLYASNGENVFMVAQRLPGARVLPGAVTTVRMAVALPKGRPPASLAALAQIVTDAKAAGLVQRAIQAQDLKGVRPAP